MPGTDNAHNYLPVVECVFSCVRNYALGRSSLQFVPLSEWILCLVDLIMSSHQPSEFFTPAWFYSLFFLHMSALVLSHNQGLSFKCIKYFSVNRNSGVVQSFSSSLHSHYSCPLGSMRKVFYDCKWCLKSLQSTLQDCFLRNLVKSFG